MRFFTLLRFQYTRYGVREICAMLLIGIVFSSLSQAMAPLIYTFHLTNMVNASLPANTLYFNPYQRIGDILSDGSTPTDQKDTLNAAILAMFSSRGAIGVGRNTAYSVSNENSQTVTDYVGYNPDMIQFTTLPLMRGSWASMASETGDIPVVVGGAYRDQFDVDVGSLLLLNVGGGEVEPIACRVVGILNSEDMHYQMSYGETKPSVYSIAKLKHRFNSAYGENHDYFVIYPTARTRRAEAEEYAPGNLLFFPPEKLMQESDFSEQYGTFTRISQMVNRQYEMNLYTNSSHIVTAMAVILFCMMGLGGYALLQCVNQRKVITIYRLCGMSKKAVTALQISSILLLATVPGAMALCISPPIQDGYRMMDRTFFIVYAIVLLSILLPSVAIILTHNRRVEILGG